MSNIDIHHINKNVVTILEIDAGCVAESDVIKITSELETSLRSQQLKVVVIHGSDTRIIELSTDDRIHQIIEIPSQSRSDEEQEVVINRIRDDLTKFGAERFTLISVD